MSRIVWIIVGVGCSVAAARGDDGPPAVAREFRAAWVATVNNIDWPSRPGLSADRARAEAIAILDKVAALRLNAVVLQVRTAADALYPSEVEPWSATLSGREGVDPGYDPLAFWVEQAHRRGLLLHAWFNPFRARPAGARYEQAPGHVSRAEPALVKAYGGALWLDPGEPRARERMLEVVADVARRYEVDGVHIDDYFYPYPVTDAGKPVDFPDDPSWSAYRAGGGPLSRGDWRRRNIDTLVESLYRVVHQARPAALVGISPFGIARPGRPPGVVGFDQYESLYADAERWLREGWCDYWSPQLYWKVNATGQPFRPLLNHWVAANRRSRHLWPGLSVSRVAEGDRGYAPAEILSQVAILREAGPKANGQVLFSVKALLRNPRGLSDQLATGPYREPAVVPATPWLPGNPPAPPIVERRPGSILSITPAPSQAPFLWLISTRRPDGWASAIVPAATATFDPGASAVEVEVAAVDRLGNESTRVRVAVGR